MRTPEHRGRQKVQAAKRKRYPSDLTDEEWLLLHPLMAANVTLRWIRRAAGMADSTGAMIHVTMSDLLMRRLFQ
jgi:hypothetical protein